MIRATATFRPRGDLGRFVDAKITPAVRQSVKEACDMIRDRAKQLCPVRSGDLRDSIETDDPEDLAKTVRAGVGPHMPYAAYVEFGTGIAGAASAGAGPYPYSENWAGMVAQPYMRPAFDEVKPKVLDVFKGHIGAAIEL